MVKIGERIKFARERQGITQKQLAKRLGVPQSNVVRWEKRVIIPASQNLIKISRILNISLEWLLTGEGEISRTTHLYTIESELGVISQEREIYSIKSSNFQSYIKELIEKRKTSKKKLIKLLEKHFKKYGLEYQDVGCILEDLLAGKILKPIYYEAIRSALNFSSWKDFLQDTEFKYSLPEKYIPIFSEISCSFPYDSKGNLVKNYISIPIDSPGIAGLVMKDNSMEPEIKERDVIIVAGGSHRYKTGDLVLVKAEEDLEFSGIVRKLTLRKDKVLLKPLNTDFDPLFLPIKFLKRKNITLFKVASLFRMY